MHRPSSGWIRSIRVGLGMTLKQLAKRLNISPQGVKKIEDREADETITLKKLKEVAAALNLQLVYGLIPKEETLEKMIENRARQIATAVVNRTAQTMHLEDQAVAAEKLEQSVETQTQRIIQEMPSYLWD
ncbi:MAG: mobile mystery protein A [Bacteroidota bacterium]